MGTNFYMLTQDKPTISQWFSVGEYELTDDPMWGYQIHLAKTSYGWHPLFCGHKNIRSVSDIKRIFDTGKFIIFNEYGKRYSWEEFDIRVLQFSNKIASATLVPKSHLRFDTNFYRSRWKDQDGFEFMCGRWD